MPDDIGISLLKERGIGELRSKHSSRKVGSMIYIYIVEAKNILCRNKKPDIYITLGTGAG